MQGTIEIPGYLAFFEALLSGRLKLGQTLTQEDMCAALGISLSPMREAITLLESEGLITVRRRIGITIFYPDVKFVGNTFQLRGVLEKEGLRKFARNVPAGWIAKQRAEHLEMVEFVRKANDLNIHREPVKRLERSFHHSFIETFENEEITAIYERLTQKMFILRMLHLDAVGPSATIISMNEHLAIIEALEQRDVETAIVGLERHFSGVLHRILAR